MNENLFRSLQTFGKKFVKDFKKFGEKTSNNWHSSFEQHDLKKEIIIFVKELEKELGTYKIKKISNFDNIEMPDKVAKQRALNILDKKLEEIRLELTPGEISLLGLDTLYRKLKRKFELGDNNIDNTFEKYLQSIDYRVEKLAKYRVENDGNIEDEISKISKKEYEEEKLDLQEEILKLQEWAIKEGKRIAIVFEGRDAAGKGSTIKRFIEFMMPRSSRVVALDIPTKWESNNWFERYEKHLPVPGEIVFFDRSWYNRAVVEPVMGYCTPDQYEDFMDKVVDWEEKLIDDGLILIKFWFSITKDRQLLRFDLRKKSKVKYWKFSENDLKSINKWESITKHKDTMFEKTATKKTPWVIVDSNDKKVTRLNAMRYVLQQIDYPDADDIKPFDDIIHVVTNETNESRHIKY